MNLLTPALLLSSAAAFAPARHIGVFSTAIFERVDSSAAIQAALEASKKYGSSSSEARVLWDIVEEMDASDNSAATKPPVYDPSYAEKLKSLSEMLEKTKASFEEMKQLASDLKGIKLGSPDQSFPPSDASTQEALATAREATEKYGIDSTEAQLAWETVEEIASASNAAAMKKPLDEECLIEFIEGCEALEKFKAALEESG